MIPMMSLDTETTGLDFADDQIVEFSSVVMLQDDIQALDLFLPAEKDSRPEALDKHGLTKEKLAELTCFDSYKAGIEAIYKLMCGMSDYLFVGMNISFDLTMLMQNWIANGIDCKQFMLDARCFDVYVADKMLRLHTNGERRNLQSLAKIYGAMTVPDHSAINDAKATFEIAYKQIGMLKMQDKSIADIHNVMQRNAIRQQLDLNKFLAKQGKDLRQVGWPYFDL